MGIREPRIPTDHQMVLGELIGEGVMRHRRYCKDRATWPITSVKGCMGQEGDSHFNDLKRRVKKPSRKGRTTMAPCISGSTWRLADQRAALGSKLTANQQECRTLM